MANSVDPYQTATIGAVCSGSTMFASILNSSVMLGNYLQQTTSADDLFRCFFGAFMVNKVTYMYRIYVHAFAVGFFFNTIRVSNCLVPDQDRMSDLSWVQTVCKGFQQKTKVAFSQ